MILFACLEQHISVFLFFLNKKNHSWGSCSFWRTLLQEWLVRNTEVLFAEEPLCSFERVLFFFLRCCSLLLRSVVRFSKNPKNRCFSLCSFERTTRKTEQHHWQKAVPRVLFSFALANKHGLLFFERHKKNRAVLSETRALLRVCSEKGFFKKSKVLLAAAHRNPFLWKTGVCFRATNNVVRCVSEEALLSGPRRTAPRVLGVLLLEVLFAVALWFLWGSSSAALLAPRRKGVVQDALRFRNEPLLLVFRQSWILNRVDITQLVRVSDCDSESTGSSPVICPKNWVFFDIHILQYFFRLQWKKRKNVLKEERFFLKNGSFCSERIKTAPGILKEWFFLFRKKREGSWGSSSWGVVSFAEEGRRSVVSSRNEPWSSFLE